MLKVVLFDLDGTLLPLDTDKFISIYLEKVTLFSRNIIKPDLFFKSLMDSTEAMLKNNGNFTNEEVFMKNFLPAVGKDRDMMYSHFNDFYEQEFPKLKSLLASSSDYSSWILKAIKELIDKGYTLVVATNPVFPEIAMKERMTWAGVLDFSWSLITSYENSSCCKPNIQYYVDICNKLNVSPNHCLMVGNDVQEDMVAGSIGMKTYLVTDFLIDRGEPGYRADMKGCVEEFYSYTKKLPIIS